MAMKRKLKILIPILAVIIFSAFWLILTRAVSVEYDESYFQVRVSIPGVAEYIELSDKTQSEILNFLSSHKLKREFFASGELPDNSGAVCGDDILRIEVMHGEKVYMMYTFVYNASNISRAMGYTDFGHIASGARYKICGEEALKEEIKQLIKQL